MATKTVKPVPVITPTLRSRRLNVSETALTAQEIIDKVMRDKRYSPENDPAIKRLEKRLRKI
jgi:hypothetical protein